MEKNMKKEATRHFAGKTEFVLDYSSPEKLQESKTERHFYQRMLRAYLRGKKKFNFAFTRSIDNRLIPIEHDVMVRWD